MVFVVIRLATLGREVILVRMSGMVFFIIITHISSDLFKLENTGEEVDDEGGLVIEPDRNS